MNLSVSAKRNLLFRWAYLFTFQETRDRMRVTTLCALFWRSLVVTPFWIFVCSAPFVLIGYHTATRGWIWLAQLVGGALGIVAFFSLMFWLDEKSREAEARHRSQPPKASFIGEAIRGIKERYCPLVRVEH